MTYAMQPSLRNGFTLIEIVSVLVVLGILAFASASAFLGNDGMEAYVERDKLLSQLIYARAQGMAMGGGQCVEVEKDGVRFSLAGGASSNLPSLLENYDFASGVSASPVSFCFDAAGGACGHAELIKQNNTGILYCKDYDAPNAITFTSDKTKAAITVNAETGFVQ